MVQFINNHKHSTSFFFLLYRLIHCENFRAWKFGTGVFGGYNFGSRDFISALIFAQSSSFKLWSTQPPPPRLPPWLMMSYCFVEWIFNKFSTLYVIWVETTRKCSFFPRSHHDSAQAYFPTFRMRFSDS